MDQISSDLIARQRSVPLTGLEKSLPRDVAGLTIPEVTGRPLAIDALRTPLVVLNQATIGHNANLMQSWLGARGLDIAPHGKTTMVPELWKIQFDHGAWAITVANCSQLEIAMAFEVKRVMLANTLVDEITVKRVQQYVASNPDAAVYSWVDSVESVQLLARWANAARPLEVLVELGGGGGRTGARTISEARRIAEAVNAAEGLQLCGVAGYEGAFAHTRDAESLAKVREYLDALVELYISLLEQDLLNTGAETILTAGGSAYFDLVADVLGPYRSESTRVVLRSGAYLVHDDGFYRGVGPLSGGDPSAAFASAMHAYARVVSHPEPNLYLLDAGKRDVSFDEGLPEVQGVAARLSDDFESIEGEIFAMNDQHSFLRLSSREPLAIGAVVKLGLSHPCTVFDKWRVLPVLTGDGQQIADLYRTYF